MVKHRRSSPRAAGLSQGTFEVDFDIGCLTLIGKVEAEGPEGTPVVTFTQAEGDAPEVDIRLSPFPGAMFPEVEKAVSGAGFLRSALGQRIEAAITGSQFPALVGRLISLAADGAFGPTHTHLRSS